MQTTLPSSSPACIATTPQPVPTRRHAVNLIASFLVMCCAGSVYAWSIFVPPLSREHGFTTAQTQLIFGLIIACFSISSIFSGRIGQRLGIKTTVSIGAVLFSAGYLVASFSGGNFWLTVLGISVLSGAGMGFAYITVLSNLVKWYPSHRGLATGLAVAGFGSGAILLSQAAQPFLNHGMEVLTIFRFVGIIYGVLFLSCALLISQAPNRGMEKKENPLLLKSLINDRRFRVLLFVFFAGSFSGMMLIGNLKPLALSYGADAGVIGIAIVIVSIGNASGRIIWGYIFDRIGGMLSVVTALSVLSILMLLLPVALPGPISFIVLCLVIGLFFGANFVIYASDVSHKYGVGQVGYIYPLISLGYGVAGILGPFTGGWIYDVTGSYFPAIMLSAIVCLCGMAVYAVFMREKKISPFPIRQAGFSVPD